MSLLSAALEGYVPIKEMPPDKQLRHTLGSCIKLCLRFRRGSGFYVPELDPSAQTLGNYFEPVWQLVGFSETKKFCGYNITDVSRPEWVQFLTESEATREKVLEAAAANVFYSRPLPTNLAAVIAELLFQEGSLPLKKRKKPTQRHRNLLFAQMANWVTEVSDFDFGSSQVTLERGAPYQPTGALIAAASMHAVGVRLEHIYANKIAYDWRNNSKSSDLTPVSLQLNAAALEGQNALAVLMYTVTDQHMSDAMSYLGRDT